MSPSCKLHAINSQGSHCRGLLASPLLLWDLKAAFFCSYYFEVLPFSVIVISKSRQAISDPDAHGREEDPPVTGRGLLPWSLSSGMSGLHSPLWLVRKASFSPSYFIFNPLILFVSAYTIKSVEFYLAKSLKKVASSSPKWPGFSKMPELYCVPISAHSSCEQSHPIALLCSVLVSVY